MYLQRVRRRRFEASYVLTLDLPFCRVQTGYLSKSVDILPASNIVSWNQEKNTYLIQNIPEEGLLIISTATSYCRLRLQTKSCVFKYTFLIIQWSYVVIYWFYNLVLYISISGLTCAFQVWNQHVTLYIVFRPLLNLAFALRFSNNAVCSYINRAYRADSAYCVKSLWHCLLYEISVTLLTV